MTERSAEMQVGVVLRRQPGVTRWAKWVWRVVGVLPGAGPADWRELRRDGEAVEYHAATCMLRLHRADTEGYLAALSNDPPCVYVILRDAGAGAAATGPAAEIEVFKVTASAHDAEEYMQGGDEMVEPVPAPPALLAWIRDFTVRHHRDQAFVKRRRGPAAGAGDTGEGAGDARVRGGADVYRAPTAGRKREPRE